MATKEVVTKVWIEPGCIVCDACETAAPDVFEVQEETCIIRPEALSSDFTKPRSQGIIDAAEECPVDVIKYEAVSVRADDEAAETTAAKAEVAPAPAQAANQPAAKATKPATSESQPTKAPVPSPAPEVPAAAKAAATAPTPAGGVGDPSIAALLRAATSRGGSAGIVRTQAGSGNGSQRRSPRDPRSLPPEARQAKILEAAKKSRQSTDARRRAFIGNTALAVGWGAFGLGTGISVGPAFGRFMMPNVLEEPDPRVRVGKLARYREMAPGEVIEDYKPQGIWMIRDGDHLAALSIICTHLGCIPNWLPNDRKFKCPCHGSGYKPDGINFEGPTPRPLERFKVYIEDGIVIVDKSKKYQYELGQWTMPGSYIEV